MKDEGRALHALPAVPKGREKRPLHRKRMRQHSLGPFMTVQCKPNCPLGLPMEVLTVQKRMERSTIVGQIVALIICFNYSAALNGSGSWIR